MEAVKVARAPLVACLTCPLCSSLLDEATTICECLHSFCRECIHLKLSEDDAQSCPICDVDLGVAPLEKLRPDPQLDELRNKLFAPGARRARVAGDASPLPRLKRKERSLYSLGVFSTPSSSRRKRPNRQPPQHYTRSKREITSSSSEEQQEEEENKSDESDSDQARKPTREEKGKSVAEGYHTPLAYLAELADSDHNTPSKRNPSSVKQEPRNSRITTRSAKTAVRRRGTRNNTNSNSNSNSNAAAAAAAKQVAKPVPPRFQVVTADTGLWFALKPGDDQRKDSVLPPITKPYVRITDGRLPVSQVKKYIAAKLNLGSETDVELSCRDQLLVSNLPVENVQTIWLAKPGDDDRKLSTAERLMTLTYKKLGNSTNVTATATNGTATATATTTTTTTT